jgi:hypothetical protein
MQRSESLQNQPCISERILRVAVDFYRVGADQEVYLASTQFEPVDELDMVLFKHFRKDAFGFR